MRFSQFVPIYANYRIMAKTRQKNFITFLAGAVHNHLLQLLPTRITKLVICMCFIKVVIYMCFAQSLIVISSAPKHQNSACVITAIRNRRNSYKRSKASPATKLEKR